MILTWQELPTVVRRSFDEFVTLFQDDNPGSNLRRTADPRAEPDRGYVVPFEDAASGAKYEVDVGGDGSVGTPVAVA